MQSNTRWDLKLRLFRVSTCLIATLLIFISCAPRRIVKPTHRVNSPQEVLSLLAEREAQIGTYAGDLRVELDSDRLNLSFDLELYYRGRSEIAFTLEMILGIEAAKGVLHGDTLRIFSPLRNLYFERILEEGRSMALGGLQLDLLSTVEFSLGKLGFHQENAEFAGREGGFYLYEMSDVDWDKKFWVSPATATVAKCYWQHQHESYDFWVNYYDFYRVNDHWRPRAITLLCPAEGVSVRIKLRQEKINVVIPDRFFQLRIPEGATPTQPYPQG